MTRAHQIIASVLSDNDSPPLEHFTPLRQLEAEPTEDIFTACRDFGPKACFQLAANAAGYLHVADMASFVKSCVRLSLVQSLGSIRGGSLEQGIEHEFESVSATHHSMRPYQLYEELTRHIESDMKIIIDKARALPDYGDSLAISQALEEVSIAKAQKGPDCFSVDYAARFIGHTLNIFLTCLDQKARLQRSGLIKNAESLTFGLALLPGSGIKHMDFDTKQTPVKLGDALENAYKEATKKHEEAPDIFEKSKCRRNEQQLEQLVKLHKCVESLLADVDDEDVNQDAIRRILADPLAETKRLYRAERQRRIQAYLPVPA